MSILMRLTIMTVILLQCDNNENGRGRGVIVVDDFDNEDEDETDDTNVDEEDDDNDQDDVSTHLSKTIATLRGWLFHLRQY